MTDYLDAPGFDFESQQLAIDYDQNSNWSPCFGELIFRHVPMRKDLCVLDVGCGTGYPCIELSQRLGSSSHIYAIDLWQAGLDRAQQKVDHFQVDNVTLQYQNAAKTDFSDEMFDLIVCNVGINNFESSPDVFREWSRIVKRGGLACMTTNPVGHMAEFYGHFRDSLEHLGFEDCLPQLEAHIAHRSTPAQVGDELVDAGFQVNRILNDSFQWRFLNGSAFLKTFHIVYAFLPGWMAVVPEQRRIEVFRDLEARINAFSESEGGFVVTVPICYIEAEKQDHGIHVAHPHKHAKSS